MLKLVRAEYRKQRHTFVAHLPFIAPAFTQCVVLPWAHGMGSALFAGIWNWWYTLLLPGMLAIFCCLGMKKDERINYYNLLFVPVPVKRCVMGKIIYAFLGLVSANFLMFAWTWLVSVLLGQTAPVMGGFFAFLVLSITLLWEIPLYVFRSARFGMLVILFSGMALQFFSVGFLADTTLWWVFPMAIPVRLMCPVLGILPNGLPVPNGSGLWDSGVLIPGMLLSLAWFLVLTVLTCAWFQRKAVGK